MNKEEIEKYEKQYYSDVDNGLIRACEWCNNYPWYHIKENKHHLECMNCDWFGSSGFNTYEYCKKNWEDRFK